MEFCFAFRQQCAWYQDKGYVYVKLSVERGIHTNKGPANMSSFCRLQMAMDSVSWCLYWEKRHESWVWSFSQIRKQSSFDIFLVGLLRMKRMNSEGNMMHSMLTLLARRAVSPTSLALARLSQELSGIVRRNTCSVQLPQWTWELPSLRLIGTTLSGNKCHHQTLQLCC